MNYTENYHLPQWDETDRIMRADFNETMAGIDEGLAAAQATANAAYSPTQKPYATGHYYGTDHALTVTLGFRPSFLIINSVDLFSPTKPTWATQFSGQTGGHSLKTFIEFTDDGFKILEPRENYYPYLSVKDRVYDYIAFR